MHEIIFVPILLIQMRTNIVPIPVNFYKAGIISIQIAIFQRGNCCIIINHSWNEIIIQEQMLKIYGSEER